MNKHNAPTNPLWTDTAFIGANLTNARFDVAFSFLAPAPSYQRGGFGNVARGSVR
jgi:hypothetical protein